MENKNLEEIIENENSEPEIKEEAVDSKSQAVEESIWDNPVWEKAENACDTEDAEDSLSVAPVEEIPEEEMVVEVPVENSDAKNIDWKKIANLVCTGLLVLLIAIPVSLLIYIIITFLA